MKPVFSKLGTAACLAALTMTAVAQANPWDGQWKSDPASMKFSGSTYKVTSDANGYTVVRGTTTTKIVCDGKPQKTENNTMTSCTKSGDAYMLDVTRDGKHVRKSMLTVSADGKTRIIKSDVTPADGSKPYTMTAKDTRVSGGPGIAGEWKEAMFSSSEDNGILSIHVKGDTVSFKETDYPAPLDCKLDGTKTKMGDSTVSVKLVSPKTLHVTYRGADDKIRRENTFVLSADGKSITETDVTPAPSPSKMTLVLHKM